MKTFMGANEISEKSGLNTYSEQNDLNISHSLPKTAKCSLQTV